jgi:hypothetical protein
MPRPAADPGDQHELTTTARPSPFDERQPDAMVDDPPW